MSQEGRGVSTTRSGFWKKKMLKESNVSAALFLDFLSHECVNVS